MISPLEALADAIMSREGWAAGSMSNRNRNPGNLRPWADAQPRDLAGFRTFQSLIMGYGALISDLHAKVSGKNAHNLSGDSTLAQLIAVWAPKEDHNDPASYAQYVAEWCSKALGRPVTVNSTLNNVMGVE